MEQLTNEELDVLSGMMVVFMHSAERCIQIMEKHYTAQYQAGSNYKQLVRKVGKPRADEIVKGTVQRIVRGDKRNNLRKLLDTAAAFHKHMDNLTETAITCHDKNTTFVQMFDHLQHDINYLCRIYSLMANCNGEDDEIKLESTIKAMAKGDRCSQRVIDMFKI